MMAALQVLETVVAVLGMGSVVVGLAVLYLALRNGIAAYVTFHGERVVTCPETHRPAGVEVDARHAALTAVRRPELRLTSCTRWPERQACGQECLGQIEASPESCLLRNILTRWYWAKSCVYCRTPFEIVHWHDHKPALLGPDGTTVAWERVPAQCVFDVLATHEPVCWSCHVAETFRREHPDRVTDRPRRDEQRPADRPN